MKLVPAVDALTFTDHVEFEDEADTSVREALALMLKGKASVRQHRALVWIFGRLVDPTFTLDDAGDLRPGDVEWTWRKDDDEGAE